MNRNGCTSRPSPAACSPVRWTRSRWNRATRSPDELMIAETIGASETARPAAGSENADDGRGQDCAPSFPIVALVVGEDPLIEAASSAASPVKEAAASRRSGAVGRIAAGLVTRRSDGTGSTVQRYRRRDSGRRRTGPWASAGRRRGRHRRCRTSSDRSSAAVRCGWSTTAFMLSHDPEPKSSGDRQRSSPSPLLVRESHDRHRMEIAIIGGGAAGMVTARLLDEAHDVTVLEREAVLGGHVRTLGATCTRRGFPPACTSTPAIITSLIGGTSRASTPSWRSSVSRWPRCRPPPGCSSPTARPGTHRSDSNASARPPAAQPGDPPASAASPWHGGASWRAWPMFRPRCSRRALRSTTSSITMSSGPGSRCCSMYAYSIPYEHVGGIGATLAIPMLRRFVHASEWTRVIGGVWTYFERICADLRGRVRTGRAGRACHPHRGWRRSDRRGRAPTMLRSRRLRDDARAGARPARRRDR